MGEGLFVLLCILALIIGSRARNSKVQSPKAIAKKKKIAKIMTYIVLVVIGLLLMIFIPAFYTEIRIALDTQFSTETYLGFVVILVGIYTFVTIFQKLKSNKAS